MKKIVTGSLITAMISNNITYANNLENELDNVNENVIVNETTSLEQGEKENITDNQDCIIENQENETNIKENITDLENNIVEGEDNTSNIEESIIENTEKEPAINTSEIVSASEEKEQIEDINMNTVTTEVNVSDFTTLKQALEVSDSTITLVADIKLEEDLNILKNNITIKGNGHTIKSDIKEVDAKTGVKTTYKLTTKASNTTIENLKFEDYISNVLTLYNAKNATLSNLSFIGNDINTKDNNDRSKVAIDIYNSTVKLENITTKNNLYRGIQVRYGSTVEVLSKNSHINDNVHIQTIKSTTDANEPTNTIIDTNGYYISGIEKENNGKLTLNYYTKNDIYINSATEFIDNLQNSGNVLHINNDINFTESDLATSNKEGELVISPNVTIMGYNNTINLNNLAKITLKGNDIRLVNLTIRNSKDIGVNIYNSRDVMLDNVNIIDSTRYGIFVNGSRVKLKNCYTSNNNEGGIMITRSRTLRGSSYIDSCVEVVDSIKHDELNINVAVKNLEMIDGYFQNNKFIAPSDIYNQYENDAEYKVLSDYYLDLFGIEGEERNKKYKEQSIDYMVIQKIINVKENTEVLDTDGKPIRLVGDGIVDETENIEKLITYAASHGRELYFPEGTYKITRDIDLSKINLPALSNFTISGEKNKLVVFDASSCSDKMLKLKNEEYHSKMNYININNIVFNNIGIEFNGPYKKGISLNNNAFINGKYTREVNSSGNITKVTMEPYIIAKNTKYSIENNIFLRDKNNPGRGISTYRTKNTTIKNNFFGNLEGINHASGMLPKDVITKLNMIKNLSSKLNISGSQGNFFTAINNERYDENINISNNYFNLDKTRNITSDFTEDVLVSGINVTKEGQRRDHIIYSKGYNGLNIFGNYFEGMENGAAGGIKIRNGKGAYIGSNHLKDVPILTYIYGDLTKSECVLYDTTIYNNLLHNTTNFGEEGTGILYYQSYRDGDTIEFKSGGAVTDTWTDSYGDVKNFSIYKNEFMSDDKDLITISGRAKAAYNANEFLAHGNRYSDTDILINYRVSGNYALPETSEAQILNTLNNGYKLYNNTPIPLAPATVDYKYINEEISNATKFFDEIKKNNMIGKSVGQYSEDVANELKDLLTETLDLINSDSLNQWDTNKRLRLIEETFNRLKASILPMIYGADNITINVGDKFDPLKGVYAKDKEGNDLTDKIIILDNSIDTTKAGKYTVKYQVTDSANQTAEYIRTIIVKDNNNNNDDTNTDIEIDDTNTDIIDNNNNNISNNNNNNNSSNNTENNINNNSNSNTNTNIDKPKTGDTSILGNVFLSTASLVGILINNRKKDRKNKENN
ncbi:MAG: DUF5011 domain-containing protein [Clostridium sp.]|nr:DUF5011 domain-containing protein [Clostridium sp.]